MRFFFFFFIIFSCFLTAKAVQKDSINSFLKLENPYKYNVIIYGPDRLSYLNDTIVNTRGDFISQLTLKSNRFYIIRVNKHKSNIFIDKNKLLIKIGKNGTIHYQGKNANVNNYLYEYIIWHNNFKYNEKVLTDWLPIDFVEGTVKYELDFKKFHESQLKKLNISSKKSNLLKQNCLAYINSIKYNRIVVWNDSLIQKKLKESIRQEDLFNDALLKANSPDYQRLLGGYYLTFQAHLIKANFKNPTIADLEAILSMVYTKIEQFDFKSNLIKEHLLACCLSESNRKIGITSTFDSLQYKFTTSYPHSEYLKIFELMRNDILYEKISKGKIAANIQGTSLNGEKISLNYFKGKPVIVDIWATWCKPCIEQSVIVKELENKYSSIIFLHVSIDSDREVWANFMKKKNIVLNQKNSISIIQTENETAQMWKDYIGSGIPRYIIIDKNGLIIEARAKIEQVIEILGKM